MDDSIPLHSYHLFIRSSDTATVFPETGLEDPTNQPTRPFIINYPALQRLVLKTSCDAIKMRALLIRHKFNLEELYYKQIKVCKKMDPLTSKKFGLDLMADLYDVRGFESLDDSLRPISHSIALLREKYPIPLSYTTYQQVTSNQPELPSQLLVCPGLDLYTLFLAIVEINDAIAALDLSCKHSFFNAGRGYVNERGSTENVIMYRDIFRKNCWLVLDDLEHAMNKSRDIASQAHFYSLYYQSFQNPTWAKKLETMWSKQVVEIVASQDPEDPVQQILHHEPFVAHRLYHYVNPSTIDATQMEIEFDKKLFLFNHPGEAEPQWDIAALGNFLSNKISTFKWDWIVNIDPKLNKARQNVHTSDTISATYHEINPSIIPNTIPHIKTDKELEKFIYFNTPFAYNSQELTSLFLPQPGRLLDLQYFPRVDSILEGTTSIPQGSFGQFSKGQLVNMLATNLWFQKRLSVVTRGLNADNTTHVRLQPTNEQQHTLFEDFLTHQSFNPFFHCRPHMLLAFPTIDANIFEAIIQEESSKQ